jgi:hypothetical protein
MNLIGPFFQDVVRTLGIACDELVCIETKHSPQVWSLKIGRAFNLFKCSLPTPQGKLASVVRCSKAIFDILKYSSDGKVWCDVLFV